MLTSTRTLMPGDVIGHGTKADYRRLAEGPGERHIRRRELSPSSAPDAPRERARALAVFVHLTDLHVMDPSSPTRLEVLGRLGSQDKWRDLLGGAFRAQETLTAHAAAQMAQTISTETGPFSGRSADVVIVTGDNIDNCQANELANYIAALEGGTVRPAPKWGYEGVQTLEWDDDWYWQPDGDSDRLQNAWGFPRIAGLLDVVARPFAAAGLGMPWLACFGNHDALLMGTARANDAVRSLAVGASKPRGASIAAGRDANVAGAVATLAGGGDPLDTYLADPTSLFAGPVMPITADATRRVIDRDDFLAAHFGPASRPHGHGFSAPSGQAHYVYDVDNVRIVMLDTTHPAGYWEGSIDAAQLTWLDDVLADADRRQLLVIVASHHATPSLINTYRAPNGSGAPSEGERHLAADLVAVLHRHRCVIGWLNGHHHANRIVPHGRDDGGFWEITTSAIIDWPCQARAVEVLDEGDGHVAIVTTMIDLADPAVPAADGDPVSFCASLHRELAANQAWQRGATAMEGTLQDRNAMLLLPHPFAR